MNILDKIVIDKKREIELKKTIISHQQLEQYPLFGRKCLSVVNHIQQNGYGIIAEHKRKSPSKQNINSSYTVEEVVKAYESADVSGISVLTDSKYFGGSLEDLLVARAVVDKPLLRKEFVVDHYQILEAKAYGADFILLIAAILTRDEIKFLSEFAKSLGLEVLLEVHDAQELEKSIMPSLDLIGVNNRNLKTFEVSIDYSKQLADKIPNEFVKVSESGLSSPNEVNELIQYGYKGFLIGENFMKSDAIFESVQQFKSQIKL